MPELSLITCSGCDRPILDKYLLNVSDQSWHPDCVKCSECKITLTDKCFSREGKLFCRIDFFRLFATKCSGCLKPIPPSDLVMRALESVYHLSCFTCIACGRQLEKGDEFVVRSGSLFCRPDFEKEIAFMHVASQTSESAVIPSSNSQSSPVSSSNNSVSAPVTPTTTTSIPRQDGRRGPKRPRTILTTAQRRAFKASFETSPKPCRKVREHLAKETGLSVRIVQVWFQNQRAKLKKIQRKQQQLQHQSSSTGSGQDSNGQSMDKCDSYTRLATGSAGHLTDSSADSPAFSMTQMQYLTHSPDDSYYSPHGGEGFSKSELGMDSESSLNGLEDVLINHQNRSEGDGSHHLHSSHHHTPSGDSSCHPHHGTATSLFGTPMTPIDKLYSMQSSYFNSSDCECLAPTPN